MPTRYWVYKTIKEHIHQAGYAPTRKEIAWACGVSESTVTKHVRLLEKMGLVQREPGRWRGLAVA